MFGSCGVVAAQAGEIRGNALDRAMSLTSARRLDPVDVLSLKSTKCQNGQDQTHPLPLPHSLSSFRWRDAFRMDRRKKTCPRHLCDFLEDGGRATLPTGVFETTRTELMQRNLSAYRGREPISIEAQGVEVAGSHSTQLDGSADVPCRTNGWARHQPAVC